MMFECFEEKVKSYAGLDFKLLEYQFNIFKAYYQYESQSYHGLYFRSISYFHNIRYMSLHSYPVLDSKSIKYFKVYDI